MKILLFANQFRLTTREIYGFKQFAVFALELYSNAWITDPVLFSTLANDKSWQSTETPNSQRPVSMGRHLSYLNESLVGLALFDPQVNVATNPPLPGTSIFTYPFQQSHRSTSPHPVNFIWNRCNNLFLLCTYLIRAPNRY